MTEFTKTIYEIVQTIPRGKTMTYKQVAELAGRPRAYRAAGNILNKNFDMDIPCHKVIRSDGKTGGYNRGAIRKRDILKEEIVSLGDQGLQVHGIL
jgi:O-6-methylguanine DNA methyltransferase